MLERAFASLYRTDADYAAGLHTLRLASASLSAVLQLTTPGGALAEGVDEEDGVVS